MFLFFTFWACSLIPALAPFLASVSLPRRGSIYSTETVFEALFTRVRGREILQSLDARSCIAEVLTPQIFPASFWRSMAKPDTRGQTSRFACRGGWVKPTTEQPKWRPVRKEVGPKA